jgi:hypothetical protein
MGPMDFRRLRLIVAVLATAVVFEAFMVLGTQVQSVRATSPWQDDPYDVVVSFARFAVPMLVLVTAVRLPRWRAPGSPDRARQLTRAAGALLAVMAATLLTEWAAVVAGAHRPVWNRWTGGLIAGLCGLSALAVALGVGLVRLPVPSAEPRGARAGRDDWLGDVALIVRRFPGGRRVAGPGVVACVRRRATALFVGLSLLAAGAEVGAQTVGEHLTDPVLIGWEFVVAAASNFAFCVVANAVAGFIARPPRPRASRVAEASAVAGTVVLLSVVAFHDSVPAMASVAGLAGLTLGPALAVAVVWAAVLMLRKERDDPR